MAGPSDPGFDALGLHAGITPGILRLSVDLEDAWHPKRASKALHKVIA